MVKNYIKNIELRNVHVHVSQTAIVRSNPGSNPGHSTMSQTAIVVLGRFPSDNTTNHGQVWSTTTFTYKEEWSVEKG